MEINSKKPCYHTCAGYCVLLNHISNAFNKKSSEVTSEPPRRIGVYFGRNVVMIFEYEKKYDCVSADYYSSSLRANHPDVAGFILEETWS